VTDQHDERAARQCALARHLDSHHPSTVLLLARRALGSSPETTAAELSGQDDDGLTLTTTLPDGEVVLRLPLPQGPDNRGRTAALLRQVRAGLPDTVPLTPLEEQMAAGGRPHGTSRSASASTGDH
jgi:hypothetical protein